MSARELLETYLEGWRLGDPHLSLKAVTPDFRYDDPATGLIAPDTFVQFVEDFKAAAAELNDGVVPSPFLVYRHKAVDETVTPHVCWCWWQAGDTPMEGAALVHYDETGVRFERLAYYAEPVG